MSSYAMTRLRADYTMIPIIKKAAGALALLVLRNCVKWNVFCRKKALKQALTMTWEQLGYEVGLECTGETVKNAMGSIHYRKCLKRDG